jgi:hypothetical protein
MPHLHKRGAKELEGVGLSHMLDCIPLDLHQEVVHEPRLNRGSTKCARRSATTEAVALPGLQLTKGRPTQELHLLVWKGG